MTQMIIPEEHAIAWVMLLGVGEVGFIVGHTVDDMPTPSTNTDAVCVLTRVPRVFFFFFID